MVREALGPLAGATPVTPVLCFVRTELPLGRTRVLDVEIVGRRGLRRLVTGATRVSPAVVADVAARLEAGLPAHEG